MREKIKFPLAILLKEKGFKGKCKEYFTDGTLSISDEPKEVFMEAVKHNKVISCLAPTITDVVMWFYEKHWIWIYTYFLGVGYSCYVIQKLQKTNPTQPVVQLVKDSITYDELFNSPTEAYESAFEYLLNNLIKTETNE